MAHFEIHGMRVSGSVIPVPKGNPTRIALSLNRSANPPEALTLVADPSTAVDIEALSISSDTRMWRITPRKTGEVLIRAEATTETGKKTWDRVILDVKPLSLSQAGKTMLKKHEAVIEGLYNDSRGFCTYGVGVLVGKWNCYLLAAAQADKYWKKYTKQIPKSSRMYLDRFVIRDKRFSELKKLAEAVGPRARLKAEADILSKPPLQLLEVTLWDFERTVRNAITGVDLTQKEFDALVSICWNIGQNSFKTSTFVRKINENKYRNGNIATRAAAIKEVEAAILMWTKNKELIPRRKAEARDFLEDARRELEAVKKEKRGLPELILRHQERE